MVLKLPTVEDFKSFAVLYSEDPEQDFFNNIVHLQVSYYRTIGFLVYAISTLQVVLKLMCSILFMLLH